MGALLEEAPVLVFVERDQVGLRSRLIFTSPPLLEAGAALHTLY